MQIITKLLNDIFSMDFDIIIPLSGCIVAFVVALILFLIRYLSFQRNKRRYEKRLLAEESAAREQAVSPAPPIAPPVAAAETAAFADAEKETLGQGVPVATVVAVTAGEAVLIHTEAEPPAQDAPVATVVAAVETAAFADAEKETLAQDAPVATVVAAVETAAFAEAEEETPAQGVPVEAIVAAVAGDAAFASAEAVREGVRLIDMQPIPILESAKTCDKAVAKVLSAAILRNRSGRETSQDPEISSRFDEEMRAALLNCAPGNAGVESHGKDRV